MKFIVFGLGNFGASVSQKLVNLGHEVIGVDLRMELVDKWKNELTHTVALDAKSPEAIRTLPLREIDVAINAIGEDPGANIMLTALLRQFSVDRIICRFITPIQKTVLEAMGIIEFVYPEADSAERLAYQLDLKGVQDSFKINDKYQLIEVQVPDRYIDHRIGEISFVDKYKILPVTIVRLAEEKNILGATIRNKNVTGLLSADTVLRRGDRLVLFGDTNDLEDFIEE